MTTNSSYPVENELLRDFNIGDERALNVLFKKFYTGLCFFAIQITNDKAIAEEFAIDVFQKAWDRRQHFENEMALKTFLYVSIRNASLNHIDKEKRKSKRIFSFLHTVSFDQEPVEDKIVHAEIIGEIQREINNLPEQCSKIIKMLYELDMTPDEVAKELEISRNTVYSQKLRGMSILRKRLSSMHFALLVL